MYTIQHTLYSVHTIQHTYYTVYRLHSVHTIQCIHTILYTTYTLYSVTLYRMHTIQRTHYTHKSAKPNREDRFASEHHPREVAGKEPAMSTRATTMSWLYYKQQSSLPAGRQRQLSYTQRVQHFIMPLPHSCSTPLRFPRTHDWKSWDSRPPLLYIRQIGGGGTHGVQRSILQSRLDSNANDTSTRKQEGRRETYKMQTGS